MEEQVQQLMQAARDVLKNSYSPYSNFPVGSALLMADGEIITGVNVENVSFGVTNCAERSAVFAAVSRGYRPKSIKAVAVAGKTEAFLPPCSVCRQVLVEFCEPDTPVYLTREDGEILTTNVRELVPFAFEALDM
ncbi:MAG: cytidine deaminase [Aerococcaceae bacterium]|nr:cytidine deaminase [Aerococcaceae bacterium]